MYDTQDELLREIQAGEDSHLDFKEVQVQGRRITFGPGEKAVPKLATALTCFANADGGVLLFGVNDAGEVIGYDPAVAEELQGLVATAARDQCEPPLDHLLVLDQLLLPGRDGIDVRVLKVEVRRSDFAVHAPKGKRPYRRVGASCLEMSMEEQARLMGRRGQVHPFEEHPVFRAGVEDIDQAAFRAYLTRRFGDPDEDQEGDEDDIARLLRNHRVVADDELGVSHPTALGLLLFSPRPAAFLGGAYVDVAVYDDVHPDADSQRDAKRFEGSVPQQIEQTMAYLAASPYLPTAARKNHLGRKDYPAYSLRAVQEGVVNALAHRDYALVGSQVRVFVFSDRIEISSPGRLHNSVTPEDLFAGAQPYRRNQLLAGFLRDFRSALTDRAYMESRGEGFLMIVRETTKLAGRPPSLEVIGDSVRLTLPAGRPPDQP